MLPLLCSISLISSNFAEKSLGLIWVETVCKGYHKTIVPASKETTGNKKLSRESYGKHEVTAQLVRIKLKPMTDCLKFLLDTPRFRGMVSELDCWMEWIENQMAEEMYDIPTEDDMDDFIGGTHEYRSRQLKTLSVKL